MGDGDRPGGPGRDGGGKPAKAALRVFRGAGARRASRVPTGPGEVAARLAALERRIEEALSETGLRARPTQDVIRQIADTTFSTIASARRWSVADFFASVRDTADGLATADVTGVIDAVLHGAYRYWWRVDA